MNGLSNRRNITARRSELAKPTQLQAGGIGASRGAVQSIKLRKNWGWLTAVLHERELRTFANQITLPSPTSDSGDGT
jgi:hypothetical protein